MAIEAVWKTEILTTKQHFQLTFGVLKIEISITESNGILLTGQMILILSQENVVFALRRSTISYFNLKERLLTTGQSSFQHADTDLDLHWPTLKISFRSLTLLLSPRKRKLNPRR